MKRLRKKEQQQQEEQLEKTEQGGSGRGEDNHLSSSLLRGQHVVVPPDVEEIGGRSAGGSALGEAVGHAGAARKRVKESEDNQEKTGVERHVGKQSTSQYNHTWWLQCGRREARTRKRGRRQPQRQSQPRKQQSWKAFLRT